MEVNSIKCHGELRRDRVWIYPLDFIQRKRYKYLSANKYLGASTSMKCFRKKKFSSVLGCETRQRIDHKIWAGRTLRVGKTRPRNVKWLDRGHTNSWRKGKTKARLSVSQSRAFSIWHCTPEKDRAKIFKGRIDRTWQMIRWGERSRKFPVHSRILGSMWLGKCYHQPGQIRAET